VEAGKPLAQAAAQPPPADRRRAGVLAVVAAQQVQVAPGAKRESAAPVVADSGAPRVGRGRRAEVEPARPVVLARRAAAGQRARRGRLALGARPETAQRDMAER
jgi:hypothetical protein